MTDVISDAIDRVSDVMSRGSERILEFVLGFGLSAVLIILLTVLAVRGLRALRRYQISRLRYERYFSSDGVFEGDVCDLYEKITNPTFLPLFMVDVEAYVYSELALHGYTGLHEDDMQYFISRFNLGPKKTVIRKRRLTAKKRGVYELGTATVFVAGEPVYLSTDAKLYVYPKPAGLRDAVMPKNTLQGDVTTLRRLISDPFSVSGIRDMAPGDPFNSINFKATARTGGSRIKVNERDFCSGRLFMIFLDISQPVDPIPVDRFETVMEGALSFASSVVKRALDSGYRVGFAANCGGEGKSPILTLPSSGKTALIPLLREMAAARIFDCDMSFSALLSRCMPNVRDADVFIMTPELLPEHARLIRGYEKRGCTVTVTATGR